MEGRTVTDSDLTPRGTDAIDPGDDRHDADPFDAAMPATPPSELRSFDRLLAGVVIGLTALSFISLLPGPVFEIRNSSLDLVLNTLTVVAAAGAAALAWIRYRIERELSALYETSAFVVLFSTQALLIGIAIGGHHGADRAGHLDAGAMADLRLDPRQARDRAPPDSRRRSESPPIEARPIPGHRADRRANPRRPGRYRAPAVVRGESAEAHRHPADWPPFVATRG